LKLREQLLSKKWFTVSEEADHQKIINCVNTSELRNTEIYLYEVILHGRTDLTIYKVTWKGEGKHPMIKRDIVYIVKQ
jgi:hypothetical protein